MRVLVTGHLGYIGTVLVPMLVSAGHQVTGLDSNLYSRCTYSAGGAVLDVPTICKDVRDVEVADIVGFDAVLEGNEVYCNTKPKCEPQLGRRGLYGAVGGDKDSVAANMAMLWILNLSDGMHSLLDIAERADLPFSLIRKTALLLQKNGLLTPLDSARAAADALSNAVKSDAS